MERGRKAGRPRAHRTRQAGRNHESARGVEHIRDILRGSFQGKDFEDTHVAGVLRDHWEDLAGTDLSPHVTPARYRRGYLLLLAESSPWMHRAASCAEDIRTRANQLLGGERIRTVRIRLRPSKKS